MNFWSGNNEEHIRLDSIANSNGDCGNRACCITDENNERGYKMRVDITNTTIFTVDVSCKWHWSKLPKFVKIMKNNFINLKRGADLRGANKNTPEKIKILDFMTVTGLGSQNRQTIFYLTEIGIVVQCGCFYGTERAFKKQVKETHKDGQFAKEYLQMLKVVKVRFSRGK